MMTTRHRTKFAVTLLTLTFAGPIAAPPLSAQESEADDIRAVVASAYIEGIHKNGSRAAIRAGFHPSFVMKVLDGGEVLDVTIEEWIARLPAEGTPPERRVTHHVPTVDVSGDAAVARVEVLFDGRHVYTDYMSLYRFSEGWRIVGKVFNTES